MTEKQFNKKLSRIRQKQKEYELKVKLKKEKEKCRPAKVKLTTTKKITIYLFVVLNILLVYSIVAMWYFADLSYLGTLITDVIGQVIVFITYAAKSTKENTVGGITYDSAMRNYVYENQEEYLDETNDINDEEELDDEQIYG